MDALPLIAAPTKTLLIVAPLVLLGCLVVGVTVWQVIDAKRRRDTCGGVIYGSLGLFLIALTTGCGVFLQHYNGMKTVDAEGYIQQVRETYGIELDERAIRDLGFPHSLDPETIEGWDARELNTLTLFEPLAGLDVQINRVTLVWTGERFALFGPDGTELDRLDQQS